MDPTTAYTDSWNRQPDPVQRPDGRRLTNDQWVIAAAVWLLAIWSPPGSPGWVSTLVSGKTKSRQDQQWPEPPPLLEIAETADFPALTGATVLTSRVSPGPGRPYEPARTDEEVAAELSAMLSGILGVPDERASSLVSFLAAQLAGPHSDVLRLNSSGSGDGSGEWHLLHRDTWGATLRVSLSPAPRVQSPPVIASDGREALLRTRLACLMTLLSDMLYVNNNSPVTFRFRAGRLDSFDGEPIAAAAAWWAAQREADAEYDDEFVPEWQTLSPAELRCALRIMARLNLVELYDGEWSGMEEFPEVPPGHLSAFLIDDLCDQILARMGEGVQIACTNPIPLAWPPSDEELEGLEGVITIVLVAGDEVAALEIDITC